MIASLDFILRVALISRELINHDGDGGDKKDDGAEPVIEDKAGAKVDPSLGALAQVVVPDVFPEVPLLPVHRNPVFPRFIKMMEVHMKMFSC